MACRGYGGDSKNRAGKIIRVRLRFPWDGAFEVFVKLLHPDYLYFISFLFRPQMSQGRESVFDLVCSSYQGLIPQRRAEGVVILWVCFSILPTYLFILSWV